MKSCPRRAPLNGFEPKYEPGRWNDRKEVRVTHNCFCYAMNVIDEKQIQACLKDPKCDVPFPQPGSPSGWEPFSDKKPKTCPNMIGRLIGDNPTILPSAFELGCPRGTSKIALVVDEDQDYHFLRQDAPEPDNLNENSNNNRNSNSNDPIGYFSQKSGALPVTNVDALGHKIFDPQLANHDFNRPQRDRLNYDRFCGYFCVPRDRPLYIKVGGRKLFVPAAAGRASARRYVKTRRALKNRKRLTRRHSLHRIRRQ